MKLLRREFFGYEVDLVGSSETSLVYNVRYWFTRTERVRICSMTVTVTGASDPEARICFDMAMQQILATPYTNSAIVWLRGSHIRFTVNNGGR